MTPAIIVSIAVPSLAEADTIAAALIADRLAACVQTHEITSHFRWEGAVRSQPEVIVTVKTQKERFKALCERVLTLHPYAVPEIVATAVVAGYGPYLEWIESETAPEA